MSVVGQDGLRRTDFPLVEALGRLRAGHPYTFSRFGDGEWSAILDRGHQNCDGQAYTPELRSALRNVLRDRPAYRLGMQTLALRRFGERIVSWIDEEGLGDLSWSDADIFHRASIRGEMGPVFEALRTRGVVLVGPGRLAALPLPLVSHVVVPDHDAWDAIEILTRDLLAVAQIAGPSPVYALSAGMGAKVLAHRVHAEHPDLTLVDFGAVWEPYVGHTNRRYHQAVLEREQGLTPVPVAAVAT